MGTLPRLCATAKKAGPSCFRSTSGKLCRATSVSFEANKVVGGGTTWSSETFFGGAAAATTAHHRLNLATI